MTTTLRVGLAGCGRIAELFHAPILGRLDGVEVVAVADADGERAQRLSRRSGSARALSGYEDLVRDDDVDAVVICLPSGLHAEAALASLGHGKHVYVEKPLATELADADRVHAAWLEANRIGMIGFNHRFDPLVLALRDACVQGVVGELACARLTLGAAGRALPDWKRSRSTGGGVALDLGSHAVDMIRFVLGREVASVSAEIASRRYEGDTAALTLTLADGLLVQVQLGGVGVQESRLELVGERGRLTADRYSSTLELTPPLPAYSRRERLARGLAQVGRVPGAARRAVRGPQDARSYDGALAAFARAARGVEPQPSPDLGDGRRSLEVVLAAEESARTGRRVTLAHLVG